MSIGKKYTYWQFIKKNGVVIPLIQRDYAQGRDGKAELRKRFLENIKDALLNKNEDEPLVLDFVYGVDDNNIIIPLDGQQRLTALWLLHWYIYLRSERNIMQDKLGYLQKFTYQTRISSRKFCEEMVNHFSQLRKLARTKSIKECIVKQTWFMSEWEQDPTVKSMLNMLGGNNQSIESIFKDCNFDDLWDKLINDSKCPIAFYYLPIDGEILQDPDDIYIKMNARGEHLTDFENFKADLIKHIGGKPEDWKNSLGENPGLELSILIDKNWTDVFWNDLPNESKVNAQNQSDDNDIALPNIDKQFFAFLNRYFLNQILLKSQKNADALNKKDSIDGYALLFKYLYGKEGKADIDLTYKDFQRYLDGGVITVDTFKALKTIFNVLQNNVNVDIQPAWNPDKEDFHFLPYLIKPENNQSESEERLKDISQIHRVVFFGICCYLKNCNDAQRFEDKTFKEWMRFVWNMARNSDVQTIDSMKNVILKINEVQEKGTHDIINVLKTQSLDDNDTYLSRQWNEEIVKAKIYDQKKEQIHKAEALFHGSIRFLIKDKDLLDEPCFNSARKDLVENDQWILNILPFFPKDNQDQKVSVTFYESKRDTIEIINRDKHIIEAVQKYLTQGSTQSQTNQEPWIETLLKIRKEDVSLFDYSTSKKVQSYSGWKDIPKCIYLYNRKNWKKDECILLASPEGDDIRTSINNRNNFIIGNLKNDSYELYIDDNDYKNDYCPNAYEGRAIVLKKKDGNDVIYCWASGYCQGDNDSLKDY